MNYILTDAELRLLNIIWDNEPLTSMDLAKIVQTELGWKRTTTYTVLKQLIGHGVCENVNTHVRSLVQREEVEKEDSKKVAEYVRGRFRGSLPRFITSFVRSEEMTKEDAAEIMDILRNYIDE